jgi:hypothetical protein
MATSENSLHRYTILASALDVLLRQHLVLVSPDKWPDKNDTKFLDAYKARKPALSVLALCLTSAAETAHHWSAFAKGTDGVRIELDRVLLEQAADRVGVFCKDVEYKEVQDVAAAAADVSRLPFLKRYPYRDEKEVRLLFTDQREARDTFEVPLPQGCIQRVVVGPELPAPLVESVRQTIKAIKGCELLRVHQTTLHANDHWINSASGTGS